MVDADATVSPIYARDGDLALRSSIGRKWTVASQEIKPIRRACARTGGVSCGRRFALDRPDPGPLYHEEAAAPRNAAGDSLCGGRPWPR